MSMNWGSLSHYISFVAPPFIGAFIGYLTNKIAIRMLFRPLKAWRILGVRVPMTPGVIPSKRRALAVNMGEMVGEHLLTSDEIGKALTQEKFQDHLLHLIKERTGAILHRDLGPLPSLVPPKFRSYFDVAQRAVTYQIKSNVHAYIKSEEFAQRVESSIASEFKHLLNNELNTVISYEERLESYTFIERSLSRLFENPAMEKWVADFVHDKIATIVKEEKSLHDILPSASQDFLITTVEDQVPQLLEKLADILQDENVRNDIVQAISRWIQDFVASLGPMAAMVGNFLNMETVEERIHGYLVDKKEDIAKWLQNEEVRKKVAGAIGERCVHAMHMPLSGFIKNNQDETVTGISDKLSAQIVSLLKEKETTQALSQMIRDNLEIHIQAGAMPLGKIIDELFGKRGKEKLGNWIKEEGVALLRSKETIAAIDDMLDAMLVALLEKPVGRLANILPAGVRDGIYLSIRKMASAMLESEVPGLVDSLNIKMVVAEKVDSLDLLKLERLLLSIMEEQFKYINLFGALLGFLIGCANLVLLL